MTSPTSQELSELIASAHRVTETTRSAFGALTVQQLNWKPSAKAWSIAQVFDHLLTANNSYFPIFDRALSGDLERTIWQRLPGIPGIWGTLLIRTVAPTTSRRAKAPSIFHPTSSDLDEGIVRRFLEQQEETVRYLEAGQDLDAESIIIPSPVTPIITYSLMDAYRIVVLHEQRHLAQAQRVAGLDGFPVS